MRKLKYVTISIVLVLSLSLAGTFNVFARSLAQTSPTLGTAASFSVLAETNITNVPTSAVSGDVGLSPATGAGIGLTDPEVGGTIYAVDGFGPAGSVTNPALLTQAINDMMSAFTTVDQPCTTTYGGVQDLTLVSPLGPGVYCADAFLLTGNLTLSGSGVWIFKSAATLTTSAGSSITGGDPCNVWWRLVSSADIFSNSSMIGTIFAGTSINMQNGASLNGRALAQAAVTLNANTIFGPVCAVAAPTVTPTVTTTIPPTSTVTTTPGPGTPSVTPTVTLGPGTASATPAGGGPTATRRAVSGLPNTGGAPIQRNQDFPWSLVILVGSSALALGLGIRAYRRSHQPKQ